MPACASASARGRAAGSRRPGKRTGSPPWPAPFVAPHRAGPHPDDAWTRGVRTCFSRRPISALDPADRDLFGGSKVVPDPAVNAEVRAPVGRRERERADDAGREWAPGTELEPAAQAGPDVPRRVRRADDHVRRALLLGVPREAQLEGDVEPPATEQLPQAQPELDAGEPR